MNSEYVWGTPQEEATQKLKTLIATPPVLSNFDNTKEITIQTDSSRYAIGCVLLQNNRPVCFKSKSLSKREIEYGQIDKEFIAVLFACKIFHNFIYGRHFMEQTDHLPLISFMKKKIVDIPSRRLQCIILKLISYDFELKFVPSIKMFFADAISRSFVNPSSEDIDIDVSDVIYSVSMASNIRKEFETETQKDMVLLVLV